MALMLAALGTGTAIREHFLIRRAFSTAFLLTRSCLEEGDWKHNYLTQPEILNYLNNVADRFDLRRSYQFNTKVTATHFNEENNYWEVTTDKGETVTAKFLVTGLGLLSATNVPNFKGMRNL